MSTKGLLNALGPVDWEDVCSPAANLPDYVNEKLYQARAIVASVPGSRPLPYTAENPPPDPPTSCAADVAARQDARIACLPEHPKLTSHALLYSEALLKEWKPVKAGKENTLGIDVFRMPADDAAGSWFARRSVHRELPFERWKAAFLGEFGEAVRGGAPVRGMGATEVLEHRKTGLSDMTVYRMAAQFPGPTAPRDFIAMVLSAESRSPVSAATSQTCPLREFIVVSKPCVHARAMPADGTIRGTYESVELVREVLAAGDGAGTHGSGDWCAGVAVEWVMVTRSDPGGSVPRFMIERGTPAGICSDAAKFFKWMRTTDLSAYDHISCSGSADDDEMMTTDDDKRDMRDARENEHSQDEAAAPPVAELHHGTKHVHSLAPPSPNPKRRRSTDRRHSIESRNRPSIGSLDDAINGTGARPHAMSDSDTDSLSFVSARSELSPSPQPPVAPSPAPAPARLPRRSHYTFPITHMDSSVEPPRLSTEWMSSTEEIAAGVATRRAQQRHRRRVRTGLAGYEERSVHAAAPGRHHPDEHTVAERHHVNEHAAAGQHHGHANGVLPPPPKEHRSLADRLLGRHPANTYTRDEERQLKAFAKAQQREEKAAHKRLEQQRKQERHADKSQNPRARRDSSATTSTGPESNYYNTVPSRHSNSTSQNSNKNDSIPRSTETVASRRAEMDMLKEQLVILQDQNALLAGRLSQMGLEGDEICNVARVKRIAHQARHQ